MMKIYEYPLQQDIVRATSFHASANMHPLSIQVQDGQPVLWAEVDPEADQVEYAMYAVYTGQQAPDLVPHVGTVILGEIVIHYYLEQVT